MKCPTCGEEMKQIEDAAAEYDAVAMWIRDYHWLRCGWDCHKCGVIVLQRLLR